MSSTSNSSGFAAVIILGGADTLVWPRGLTAAVGRVLQEGPLAAAVGEP